jgi:adenine-specific DNA-methyltransferase
LPVFEEATTYPNIVLMTKSEQILEFLACNVTTLDFQFGMGAYLEENKIKVKLGELSPEGWTLSDSTVQALLSKIKSKGVPLGGICKWKNILRN